MCRLTSHTGKTKALSADSCKHILDSFSGACVPETGIFWVQDMQVNVINAYSKRNLSLPYMYTV